MKTKEQLQDQIEAMEKKLETLKEDLKQIKDSEPKFKEKWRPHDDAVYKAIDDRGDVYKTSWQGDWWDLDRKAFNNVFPLNWDLTDIIQKVRETLFFAECAKRLNPEGWKPDWYDGEQPKFYVEFAYDPKQFMLCGCYVHETFGATLAALLVFAVYREYAPLYGF